MQTCPTEEAESDAKPWLIVVVGAAGEPEYGEQFETWAGRWLQAVESTDEIDYVTVQIGGERFVELSADDDRSRLREAIRQAREHGANPLWLVLIGHGTFDGQVARFNLTGPDVSAEELSEWLGEDESLTILINCASSSGPFINVCSAPNRIVVTATNSGFQYNFARFGDFLSQAIADPALDLDKDGQTSLLEAVIGASRQTQEFYEMERRLATEHALIDDNYDGRGTPLEWFRGVRAVRQARSNQPLDGTRANQVALVPGPQQRQWTAEELERRNQLELQLEALRDRKSDLDLDDYYRQLEAILLQLGAILSTD